MLDQTFLMVLPFILVAIALAFDSIIFAFFGGISAVFVGLLLLSTLWIAIIFVGLGAYFILISGFAALEEQ